MFSHARCAPPVWPPLPPGGSVLPGFSGFLLPWLYWLRTPLLRKRSIFLKKCFVFVCEVCTSSLGPFPLPSPPRCWLLRSLFACCFFCSFACPAHAASCVACCLSALAHLGCLGCCVGDHPVLSACGSSICIVRVVTVIPSVYIGIPGTVYF